MDSYSGSRCLINFIKFQRIGRWFCAYFSASVIRGKHDVIVLKRSNKNPCDNMNATFSPMAKWRKLVFVMRPTWPYWDHCLTVIIRANKHVITETYEVPHLSFTKHDDLCILYTQYTYTRYTRYAYDHRKSRTLF